MASEGCCGASAAEPVSSDYTPVGSRVMLGDTEVYLTGAGGSPVVLVYDIFGFAFPQIFQVADRIAAADGGGTFSVAVPDVLRGAPWPKDKFPPKPEDNLMEWILSVSEFGKVKADIDAALGLLRQQSGASTGRAGAIGFCWGAAMTIQCGSDASYGAVGGAHPSFGLLPDKAEAACKAVQCPVVLIPAKGDDVSVAKAQLQVGPFSKQCVYAAYEDQVHGFLTARGDWNDPKVAAAATEALGLIIKFLKASLRDIH